MSAVCCFFSFNLPCASMTVMSFSFSARNSHLDDIALNRTEKKIHKQWSFFCFAEMHDNRSTMLKQSHTSPHHRFIEMCGISVYRLLFICLPAWFFFRFLFTCFRTPHDLQLQFFDVYLRCQTNGNIAQI